MISYFLPLFLFLSLVSLILHSSMDKYLSFRGQRSYCQNFIMENDIYDFEVSKIIHVISTTMLKIFKTRKCISLNQ